MIPFSKSNVAAVKRYIASGYLTLNKGRILYHGKPCYIKDNGCISLRRYDGKVILPNAAMTGWMLLGKELVPNHVYSFVNGNTVTKENVVAVRHGRGKPPSYTVETAIMVRADYRNRGSVPVTFETLRSRYGISNHQIINILYHLPTDDFWKKVEAAEPAHDRQKVKKSQVVTETKTKMDDERFASIIRNIMTA